jgi:shikimate kinase
MSMGEHEVRNKEYEVVKALLARQELSPPNAQPDRDNDSVQRGLVVSCSDGIILDDECLSLLCQGQVVIADEAMTPEELWEKTKADPNPAYAFLSGDDEEAQYQKYLELYRTRMPIYRRISI